MSMIVARRASGGSDKLCLRFPAASLKGMGSVLSSAISEEGRFVSDGASSAWRFESVKEEEGAGLALGPDPFGGRAFRSLDEAAGLEDGLGLLLVLARRLASLAAEGALPRGIISAGLLVSGEELLVLPPQAATRALVAAGAAARGATVARLSSPLADSPEADASFLLAQAAYRFATGRGPYGASASEPGSAAPGRVTEVAASLAAPLLDAELAALADRALADPRSVPLASWVDKLEKARASGWKRPVSEGEAAELERRRAAAEAVAAAKKKRADFWRKRGGIVAAVAVALVVAGLVGGDLARAQRSKPSFASLGPSDLVSRYYKALDDIDVDSMEACGDSKVFESDYNYVMNVTVLTKTRIAYEGKSPVVRAQDWVSSGEPALAPTDFLYGVSGLSVALEAARGSDSLRYRASYSLWAMDHKEDPSGNPSKTVSFPLEDKRVDELTLERSPKWKGWRITRLERHSSIEQ